MDVLPNSDKELIFRHEVLRARLDIRDFFLNNCLREIYENIGQVLTLVRIHLTERPLNTTRSLDQRVEASSELIGQSIRDLRDMSRSFYPDADILKEEGFTKTIEKIIGILYPDNQQPALASDIELSPGVRLILFNMSLEILKAIRDGNGEFTCLSLSCTDAELELNFCYEGDPIPLNSSADNGNAGHELTLEQRAHLIKGRFASSTSAGDAIQLKLYTPLK